MLWIGPLWVLLIGIPFPLFRRKSDTSSDLDMPRIFLVFRIDWPMPLQLCIDFLIDVRRIDHIGLLTMALDRNCSCSDMVLDIASLPNPLNFCVNCRSTLFWGYFLVGASGNFSHGNFRFRWFFWLFCERFLRTWLFDGKFVADHPVRKLFFRVKLWLKDITSDRGAETHSDCLSNIILT